MRAVRRSPAPLASLLASIALSRSAAFSPAALHLRRATVARQPVPRHVAACGAPRCFTGGCALRGAAGSRVRHVPGARVSMSSPASHTAGQDLKELFDVYEPPASVEAHRGEPTSAGYSLARTKVHAQGLWHRAVHLWLYTPDGRVVLQRRAQGKDTFPGLWDCSAAGHVTAGDGVVETVLKEVEEELGVKISQGDLEPLGTIATSVSGSSPVQGAFTCNEYKSLFLLRFDGQLTDLKFDPAEVEAVEARPLADLAAALRAQSPEGQPQVDGPFVPRPAHYLALLLPALEAKFS